MGGTACRHHSSLRPLSASEFRARPHHNAGGTGLPRRRRFRGLKKTSTQISGTLAIGFVRLVSTKSRQWSGDEAREAAYVVSNGGASAPISYPHLFSCYFLAFDRFARSIRERRRK